MTDHISDAAESWPLGRRFLGPRVSLTDDHAKRPGAEGVVCYVTWDADRPGQKEITVGIGLYHKMKFVRARIGQIRLMEVEP